MMTCIIVFPHMHCHISVPLATSLKILTHQRIWRIKWKVGQKMQQKW